MGSDQRYGVCASGGSRKVGLGAVECIDWPNPYGFIVFVIGGLKIAAAWRETEMVFERVPWARSNAAMHDGSGWQSSPSMSLPQMERADEVLLHVDYRYVSCTCVCLPTACVPAPKQTYILTVKSRS